MKKILLFVLVSTSHHFLYAQAGEWTWMKGDSTTISNGVFGTQGIADSANVPPGLYEACEWKDKQGNFWIYGGYRPSSTPTSNLWMYNPLANKWTWVKGPGNTNGEAPVYGTQGVPASANTPGARWGIASWVDSSGNLWLFGGEESGSNWRNDLWSYSIATNEWTWMKGTTTNNSTGLYGTQGNGTANTKPGARSETVANWTDNENCLWLFGGEGYASNGSDGVMNDVWKYSIDSDEWTWVRGSKFTGNNGSYGALGVEDTANNPPARMIYTKWKDGDGNFWIFAGGDFLNSIYYNDVWRYNPFTNKWTWMSGTNLINDFGEQDSFCISGTNLVAPSRFENRCCWVDDCFNFWEFGGARNNQHDSAYNDLWHFNYQNLQWTMIHGSVTINQDGSYGIQGIPGISNEPPSRSGANAWVDDSGNLWMFGGTKEIGDYYNDIWKYVVDPACPALTVCNQSLIQFAATQTMLCETTCIDYIDNSINNPTSWQWSFPGGNPSTSSLQNPASICYNTSGIYDVTLITTNANGIDTLTLAGYIIVNALPSSPVITQNVDTLISSPANSYQWYYTGIIIPGATNQDLIITQAGEYSVVVTNSAGCTASNIIEAVLLLPQGNFYSGETTGCPESCFDFINSSVNATMYQWFFTGGNPSASSLQDPSNICYANPGVFDVMLIASSNFSSDTLLQSGYITVFTPIVVSISQYGNLLTCNPAASSYQWWLNGNQIPGATSQSLFITQAGTYTVEVIDSNGCSSSAIINVTNIPSSNFSVTDTTLCEKFCISFTDESTNNPTSWQWIFPGGDPASSADQNPLNVCYQNPGVFDVTLITTDANGYNDTLTLANYITVYTNPFSPVITQNGNTLTSTPATSYQWQLNSVNIPGATNQSYTITQSGLYTIVIGDDNGCIAQSSVDASFVGIESAEENFSVNIYPNPSNGSFMVELLHGQMEGMISLCVINALAQEVFSSEAKITVNDWVKEIDLCNGAMHCIAAGVYFLEIKSQNISLKKKIIITN